MKPVISCRDYTITIEWSWFGPIIHADVYSNWSKTIKKNFQADIAVISRSLNVPLYAFHTGEVTARQRKFLKICGFDYHCKRVTGDGELVDFYRRLPWTNPK